MKAITMIGAILFSFFLQVRAQDKLTCVYDDWADRHNDNIKFNTLIDQACNEINTGLYEQALVNLTEAVALSAADNGGEPNAFINAQHTRLKNFIETQKSEVGEKKPDTNSSTEQKVQNAPENEPVIEVVDANEMAPIKEIAAGVVVAKPQPEPVVEPVPELPVVQSEEQVVHESNIVTPEIEIEFTDLQKEEFRLKGEQKIKQFENYFYQIGSKSTPSSISTQAIENAVMLFDRDDRTIQVSSLNKTEKPKFKVKVYLQRVKNLNYEEIKVEWADFQYASEFQKGRDGNYHGYVIFSQRFTGIRDNQVVYEDITIKRQEIILKVYEKALQGEMTDNWDVFLGDMSVVQTSEN